MTMGTTRQLRIEDEPLLRGKGRYTADVREPRQAVAAFLRAPMASATIRRLDTAAAQQAPGVLAVLTAVEMIGTGSLAHPLQVPGRGGSKLIAPRWPALAEGCVFHAGQAVAMVVAETHAQAQDAVELIEVDYDERAAVVDARRAIEAGAPQVWPEAPGNVALDFTWPLDKDGGNTAEVAKIIAGAPLVARLSVSNQRLAVASMEPRTATGWYDAKTGEYTLRTGTQSVWLMANQMAELLGVKPEQMRV
ncbi:MAG: xanthine dehydrogenase family protein molybdopterin-binding subunit, partial [Alphaproteobacteria bacterium]|nr:xanthine dehydrogenase family protein molybdopterin-binding subunit [Alphaproteobacteria bacterium]